MTPKHTNILASGTVESAAGGAVFITPNPAPKNADIRFFTRLGGVSEPPFDSLNISTKVGDAPENVGENLSRIKKAMDGNPSSWVRQVAGDSVVHVSEGGFAGEADALITREENLGLVVGVADCVPVALVGEGAVGMVHSGWRGTLSGISGKAARAMIEESGWNMSGKDVEEATEESGGNISGVSGKAAGEADGENGGSPTARRESGANGGSRAAHGESGGKLSMAHERSLAAARGGSLAPGGGNPTSHGEVEGDHSAHDGNLAAREDHLATRGEDRAAHDGNLAAHGGSFMSSGGEALASGGGSFAAQGGDHAAREGDRSSHEGNLAGRGGNLVAYIGPCIRRCCYEVSGELAGEFEAEFGEGVVSDRRLSLPDAIRVDLERSGVSEIHDLGICAGCRPDLFFSHRMEKPVTGRNLAAVSMKKSEAGE